MHFKCQFACSGRCDEYNTDGNSKCITECETKMYSFCNGRNGPVDECRAQLVEEYKKWGSKCGPAGVVLRPEPYKRERSLSAPRCMTSSIFLLGSVFFFHQ